MGLQITIDSVDLPAVWTNHDTGNATGLTQYNNGVYTLFGEGGDISGTSDVVNFLSQPLNGDGVLLAEVSNQVAVNSLSKAGLMFRETSAPNSREISIFLTTTGLMVEQRDSVGGSTTTTSINGVTSPVWLKIDRRGNTVWLSYSSDDVNWKAAATLTTSMGAAINIGLAVSSDSVAESQANFSGVQVLTGSSTGDGIADWWAQQYFQTTAISPNSSPDGNGLTLLQDYQQGNDPTNYYSQGGTTIVPTITIVSGNGQLSDESTLTANPLVVQVTNGTKILQNAPVTFSCTPGNSQLRTKGFLSLPRRPAARPILWVNHRPIFSNLPLWE